MYFNSPVSRSNGIGEALGVALPRSTAVAGIGKRRALQKFLIPVDGSPASIHAVQYAIRHANLGARVHLMNVQPPILSGEIHYVMSMNAIVEARHAAGEHALKAAKALLDSNQIEYTTEIVFGSPARAIVRCALDRKCTKIVMGTQGRSLLGNLISRSVSNRVVRLAHVPVTLIKEGGTVRRNGGSPNPRRQRQRQGTASAHPS